MLRHVLLVILSDAEPRHGYAILKAARRRTGFEMSPGTVYREIQRLRRLGQIQPTGAVSEADPRRVVYRITVRGREATRAWLTRRPRLPRRVTADEIDYRLAAFDAMERDRALVFLDELQMHLRLSGALLDRDRAHHAEREERLAEVLLERQARHVEADIAFIAALRARVNT